MRHLASKEGLLHLDPLKRMPLPELLVAVGGLEGDDSGPSPLHGVHVQKSLDRAGSLPPSIAEVPEPKRESPCSSAADPSTSAAGAAAKGKNLDRLNTIDMARRPLDTLEEFDATGSV